MDERLMERIDSSAMWEPNSGCHLWLGALVRDHGVVKWEGKNLYVHRIAWEHERGSIPSDMMVLHKCGVGACFNVNHLALGTRLDNAADRRRHGGYLPNYGAGRLAPESQRIFSSPYKRATRSPDQLLDQIEARRLFDYDPETGALRWRARADRERDWNTRFSGAEAGAVGLNGRRYVRLGDKLYLAHRLIWLWMTGEWPVHQIDHVNREPEDNRWDNLRAATNQQNQLNTGLRSTNKSGIKGVDWDERKRAWRAMITVDYKQQFLGYFTTIEEATAARQQAEEARDRGEPIARARRPRRLQLNSASGVNGVWWDARHQYWQAMITVAGKQHFLGHFDTVDDAAKARLAAEFARDRGEPIPPAPPRARRPRKSRSD